MVADDFYDYLAQTVADSRKGKKLTADLVKKITDEGPFTARGAAIPGLIDRPGTPADLYDTLNDLVDELGTLDDAIRAAAALAKRGTSEPELLLLLKSRLLLEYTHARLATLAAVPELAEDVRAVAGLLRLREASVGAVLPYRVAVK